MVNNQFEWYYVDFHNNDGYDLVFTWHTNPFMSVFRNGIIDCSLYRKGKMILHHFMTYPMELLEYRRDPFSLRYVEQAVFEQNKNAYHIDFQDKGFSLRIDFTSWQKNTTPIEEELNPDPDDKDKFLWRLLSPLCRGNVKLQWQGKTWDLSGDFYHDYNAGNIFFKEKLKSWIWQKIYIGDELYISGAILSKNNWSKNILVQANMQGVTMIPGAHMKLLNKQIHLKIPESSGLAPDRQMTMTIEKQKRLENLRFFMGREGTLSNKLREAGSFISGKAASANPLNVALSNVHYERYRFDGLDQQGNIFYSFQEKIHF